MEDWEMELEHPKKRRRRMQSRKPLVARLIFDGNLPGDEVTLSPDLWSELFPDDALLHDGQRKVESGTRHVALTPQTPFRRAIDEKPWTISVASRYSRLSGADPAPQSTLYLSPTSAATQSLLQILEALDQNRHGHNIPKHIEVQVIDVEPVPLDVVYVTVEKSMLQKVDDIQRRFGGGFHPAKVGRYGKSSQTDAPAPQSRAGDEAARLSRLVRDGLARIPVLHSGDVFHLPLPSHPITHVRPPPAIAIHCEPVLQGIVHSSTKIVLVQAGSSQERALKQLQPPPPILEESIEDTAEDTSNDQFFSAAEDRLDNTASEIDGVSSEDNSETEDHAEHSDDASDDSMDEMISLSAPTLPPAQSGPLSAMTAATPRPGDRKTSGVQTPDSVYSSFTSATAKVGNRPGKVFKTEALLQSLPNGLLHPRPCEEDDEDTFVFVETSTLAKIGCFSGEWVRIEVAKNVSTRGFPPLGITGLNGFDDDESDWRTVRIYGLTGLPNQRPRYVLDKPGERRPSFMQHQPVSLTPTIFMSPVLLANMSNAVFVKVGVLPKPPRADFPRGAIQQPKPAAPAGPPLAKEVTLLKVSTPLATNRDMQPILFSGLKQHFESRRRIVKKGDLIAISVDEELGRSTFSSANTAENPGFDDDMIARIKMSDDPSRSTALLAWFLVSHISTESIQDIDDIEKRDVWGGVAMVDPLNARMSQAGSQLRSLAESTIKQTEYWLGTRKLPKVSSRSSVQMFAASDLPPSRPLALELRMRDLVTAATSPRAINLAMPPLVILLHSNQRSTGKSYTATKACAAAGLNAFAISGHELLAENASTTGGGDVKTEALLKARAERAMSCGPEYTALLLLHIEVLTADRVAPALQEIISSLRVLIATTTELGKVPPSIRSLFTHEFEVTAPNEAAREVILSNACASLSHPVAPSVSTKSIALQTAALVAGDLVDVVTRSSLARSRRVYDLAASHWVTSMDLQVAGGQTVSHILPSDFTTAITAARATFSDAIGAPKIPTVTWQDVGGLATQKDAIMETISLPLTRPELFANGVRKRSGILFYGPPGTGKTLLAKAIATEFSLNFFSVKGPELLNMYIGESEANVRRVFQRARDARPCVVFFDELDSVAPKRGNQGDSGGVMDRIVSQLLAELDGMSSGGAAGENGEDGSGAGSGGVFVIGATNRPDLLDPALLRPGRFDKMLYLGVASDHDQQTTILQALTRKFNLAPGLDLKQVANKLPTTYTGADLYALCSDAILKAITRKTKEVDQKVEEASKIRGEPVNTGWFFDHMAGPEDIEVVVNGEDFSSAQHELVGSVSAKELEHFERIRSMFESQDIGSGTSQDRVTGSTHPPVVGLTSHALPQRSGSFHTQVTEKSHTLPLRPALTSRTSGKGKGRSRSSGGVPTNATTNSTNSNKGKGKQRAIANPDSGPELDEEEHDRVYAPLGQPNGTVNGVDRGKGKQKVSQMLLDGFGSGSEVEGDDEGLYS